jgi:hypothetical protein
MRDSKRWFEVQVLAYANVLVSAKNAGEASTAAIDEIDFGDLAWSEVNDGVPVKKADLDSARRFADKVIE